jgi:hypothetical protein
MSERDSICASEEKLPAVEYRDVPGFPGYRVGSDGTLWTSRNTYGEWKQRVPSKTNGGYLDIRLRKDSASHKRYMHRLIALAFIGEPPDGTEVNHKNGNRLDNRAQNLEYVTRSHNIKHAQAVMGSYLGNKKPSVRLTNSQIIEIRLNSSSLSVASLAGQYGASQETIRRIADGRTHRDVN